MNSRYLTIWGCWVNTTVIAAAVVVGAIAAMAAWSEPAGAAEPLASTPSATATDQAALREGWQTIRQFDCARCHGKDFEGSVGPSLIAAVRSQSREDFLRLLLDGNVERGMPAYRSVPRIAQAAEAIYAYFKARADGRIGPGAPPP